MSSLLETAVANNAQWCDAVCRRAGLPTGTDGSSWWTAARSPEGYPDAVTLRRGVPAADLLSRVDASSGCSVKDSYADLDLGPYGFHLLFDATWIARHAGDPSRGLALDWRPVSSPPELAEWAAGHGEASAIGLELVGPDLRLLSGRRAGRLVAGVAFNRSAASVAGPGLGISNLFVLDGDGVEVWQDVVTLADRIFPGLPLVGYERGRELDVARAAGFAPLGPLRVWMR